MENRKFYLRDHGKGWRVYDITAGTVGSCGTLIPYDSELTSNIKNEYYKAYMEVPASELDVHGNAPIIGVMRSIQHTVDVLQEIAEDILSSISDTPSGRYLYRLDQCVCNALVDALNNSGFVTKVYSRKVDRRSVDDSLVELRGWNIVICVVKTAEGSTPISIDPLASIAYNYCMVPKKDRFLPAEAGSNIFVAKPYTFINNEGKAAIHCYNPASVEWISDGNGLLYANKTDTPIKREAKRREVTVRNPGMPAVKKTQELRWVDVEETSVNKMNFN